MSASRNCDCVLIFSVITNCHHSTSSLFDRHRGEQVLQVRRTEHPRLLLLARVNTGNEL